jgi:hypothetical protein
MNAIKKCISLSILCCSGLATTVTAAPTMDVSLTGGFYATSERTIGLGGEKSAFVYSVMGASTLSDGKGGKWRISIECLGFDELGNSSGTQGVGRCIWKDADNHHLYVSVSTHGETNRYTLLGGTGKWDGAKGKIDTNFTYLPAPSETVFLGTDEGKGRISAHADKK